MRIAHIIGALNAASLVVTIDRNQGARSYPYTDTSPAPIDHGTVIDTTPESKRAKRRKQARNNRNDK